MKSISHLANDLGVTPAIIRSWQINLNLDHPRYNPEDPVYNSDWSNFFQEVARLRKQGKSFSKIRSALSKNVPSADHLPDPNQKSNVTEPPQEKAIGKNKTSQQFQPPEVNKENSQHTLKNDVEADDLGVYGPPKKEAVTDELSFSFTSKDRPLRPNLEDTGNSLMRMQANETGLAPVQHLQRDMYEAMLEKDMGKMAHTYVQMMENYQTLASRFSESAYVLGQLEEKNKALENQLKDKESHFQEKEEGQIQRIKELESHLEALKSSLDNRESDLTHQKEKLVQKDQIDDVEKQIKMLAVTVFKQQEALKESQNQGFWKRVKQRWLSN